MNGAAGDNTRRRREKKATFHSLKRCLKKTNGKQSLYIFISSLSQALGAAILCKNVFVLSNSGYLWRQCSALKRITGVV